MYRVRLLIQIIITHRSIFSILGALTFLLRLLYTFILVITALQHALFTLFCGGL
jgi:hypothetical protein